jgi:DNA-directed RNA polymerase subunit alpha
VLPVDAIYNPVRKVEYSVERMMVGQQTDWERLILQVWTDGAVTPLSAIQEASENLVQHFFMFNQLSRPADSPLDTTNLPVASEVYLMPIERLDLSSRTLNCLKRAKLDRVGQVLDLSADDLLNIRNFGQKSLEELQGKLAELGVSAPRAGDVDYAEDYLAQPGSNLVFDPDPGDDYDLDYEDDGE